jgi:hypothetical protein
MREDLTHLDQEGSLLKVILPQLLKTLTQPQKRVAEGALLSTQILFIIKNQIWLKQEQVMIILEDMQAF